MRHFNEKRELVEGDPCEFWDDVEYMRSMDMTMYYIFNPDKCDFPRNAIEQQKMFIINKEMEREQRLQ